MALHAKKGDDSSASDVVVKDLFNSEELSQQTRVAIFVISLLNFSVEVAQVTEGEKSILENQEIDQPCTDVDGRYSWNNEMMTKLATELHIPEQFVEIYFDLMPTEFSPKKSDLHHGYLSLLKSTPSNSPSSADSICNIITISKLTIFLIANGSYNSRGRAYIQNMCAVMDIPNEEYVRMERSISKGLSHIQASLSRLQQEAEEGNKKGPDYKRFAKIGVVSVGAGALMAFTGGLAAPAVAAALLVFGTSTAVAAAAFTSATVMSGLFGSAGMGLAGYKMVKRTRGISEFVFESEDNFGSQSLLTDDEDVNEGVEKSEEEGGGGGGKWSNPFDKIKLKQKKEKLKNDESEKEEKRIHHLSVMICVSGWMIDKEDYKKSFGIVPHHMQDEERLRRFYQIHCPQKVERAAEDIRAWKNSGGTSGTMAKEKAGQKADERSSFDSFKNSMSSNFGNISSAVVGGNDMDEFYQNLADIYGADPRLVESLVPPPLYPPLSDNSVSGTDMDPSHSGSGEEGKKGTALSKSSDKSDKDDDGDELMSHILEFITIAFENKKNADERLAVEASEQQKQDPPAAKMRIRTPTASPIKFVRKKAPSDETTTRRTGRSGGRGGANSVPDSDDDSDLEEGSECGETVTLAGVKLEERQEEEGQQQEEDKEVVNANAVAEAQELVDHGNDTQARLESDFWHWNQTSLSGAYELNLLRWETPMQLELGKSIQQMLQDLTEAVTTKVLQATVLAALVSAVIVPYSIMKFMDKIDNIWDIATERADLAGKMLAHVLLKRPQGSRSVTLVGHSMGARLIFACLQELYHCKQLYLEARQEACREEADKAHHAKDRTSFSKRKPKKSFSSSMMSGMKSIFDDDKSNKNNQTEQDPSDKTDCSSDSKSDSKLPLGTDRIDGHLARCVAGSGGLEDFSILDLKDADNIVQDVVLLGIPSSTNRAEWSKARAVVSGRFINGFSKNDIILALIYRYNKLAIKVAGLREIHVNGVENIDFSDTVKKHTDYCLNMPAILESINLMGAPNPENIFMHHSGTSSDDEDGGAESGNTDAPKQEKES